MLDSAKQKIERAEHHILNVERQFTAFAEEKPHRFVVKTDDTGCPQVVVRYVKDIPPHFALIIGDAFHNMRCALDHMTWEAVGISGTQDKYLKFSTGQDRVSFDVRYNIARDLAILYVTNADPDATLSRDRPTLTMPTEEMIARGAAVLERSGQLIYDRASPQLIRDIWLAMQGDLPRED